ncbi:hypothetical protein [Phaeobacter porticola]|uniref:hypothetical protein n=1 Tax=Phaeobacter porticola TaxID=1844006 RepID=UPI000930C530|nr:hypothetical protein [Phaeobacter porticola]
MFVDLFVNFGHLNARPAEDIRGRADLLPGHVPDAPDDWATCQAARLSRHAQSDRSALSEREITVRRLCNGPVSVSVLDPVAGGGI